MNCSSTLSKFVGAALIGALAALLSVTPARAQVDYYYDGLLPTGNSNGSAGDNFWDQGITPDWVKAGSSGDTVFPSYANGPAIANFDGTGNSDVTVVGTVQPQYMEFSPGAGNTVTIDAAPADVATNTPAGNIDDILAASNVYNRSELVALNSGSVTINAPIYVDQSAGAGNSAIDDYNGNSANAGAYIDNNGTGTLKLAGAISYGGSSNGLYEGFSVRNAGGGSVLFDSSVTSTNTVPIVVNGAPSDQAQPFYLNFDAPSATAVSGEFGGDIRGANTGTVGGLPGDILSANSGILLLDNNKYDVLDVNGFYGVAASALTNGAVTVTATITNHGTIGGYTADTSTFSGTIGINSGNYTLTAATGGKVYFTGDLMGGQITVTGPGIVDISHDNSGQSPFGNYDYESGYRGAGYQGGGGTDGYDHYTASTGSNSDVGTVIQSGTTIISNTTGSAFGAGANQPRLNSASNGGPVASAGVNNLVDLDAGAALGGTGYSQQEIVALDHTSIITPGEMAQDGTSSIGTLHLDNGLSATSGLTGNFQLGPTSNDRVEISTASTEQFTYYSPQANGGTGGLVTVTADINGAPTTALTLDGNVTFNLSGTINPLAVYTLMYSKTGTPWDIDSADYAFTGAPTGFTAYEQHIVDDGSGNEDLDVAFRPDVIPEPSTWALFGLGALVLVGGGKFRKLRA